MTEKKVDSEFYKKVGVNLKFLREERGLTLIELGKMAMCSGTTINKVELNLGSVNLWEHIDHLAEALNVPVDVLTEDNMQINADMAELHEAIERMEIKDPIIAKADALVLATSERGPRERVKALLIRAEMDMHRGRYESALNFANFALGIVERTSDKLLTNQVRYRIASIHLMLGNNQHVKNIINRDIRQLSDTEDSTLKARSLFLIAQSTLRENELLDAETYAECGIRILLEHCPTYMILGRLYHTLANVHKRKKMLDDASDCYEKALVASRQNFDKVGEFYILLSFAENSYDLGQTEKTLDILQMAQNVLNTTGTESESSQCLLDCFFALCEKDHLRLIDSVTKLADLRYSRDSMKEWYLRIARLSHTNGDYATSQQYYEMTLVQGNE